MDEFDTVLPPTVPSRTVTRGERVPGTLRAVAEYALVDIQ
jgi:hypothetical protein